MKKRKSTKKAQPPKSFFHKDHKWLPLAWFLLLFLVSLFAINRLQPPTPALGNVPTTAFAADRAFAHVHALTQTPHPVGTAAHTAARHYLTQTLTDLGLTPETQHTTIARAATQSAQLITINNVIARLPGRNSKGAILLVAHYDSLTYGPGSNDNGTGVAALLETARALLASETLDNDVIFLFTDAEEIGLFGAEAFVKEHPLWSDVQLILNFEARGTSGPSLLFQMSAGNQALISQFAQASPPPRITNSLAYEIYQLLPNDTDFTRFQEEQSVPGFNFAYINRSRQYHTPLDNLDHVDLGSLQHHGQHALTLTRHFGNLDLTSLATTNDSIFFDILAVVIVRYPTWFSLLLTVGTTAATLFILFQRQQQQQIRWQTTLLATLALFAITLLILILNLLIWFLGINTLHPEFFWMPLAEVYPATPYMFALTLLTAVIALALYRPLARRLSLPNLYAGATFLWLSLTLASTVVVPTGNYLFVWPLLFTLPALWRVTNGHPLTPITYWRGTLLAATSLLLLAPVIYLLYIALTISYFMVPLTLFTFALWLLIPYFDGWLRPPYLLRTLFALSTLIFAYGFFTATFDDQHPEPRNIFYAFNVDNNQAVWASLTNDPNDPWSRQLFTDQAINGPIANTLPAVNRSFYHTQAPPITCTDCPLGAGTDVTITLLNQATINNQQHLELLIYPNADAPLFSIRLPGDLPIADLQIDEQSIAWNIADPTQDWAALYWSPPQNGIHLYLVLDEVQDNLQLATLGQWFTLPPFAAVTNRPASLMPTQILGDSTFIWQSHAIPLAP